MAELMQTPSQRHVIPLQGRPYEKDTGVSGLLTIEFLFKDCGTSWEEPDLVPGVHRTFEAVEGRDVLNKKTVYSRQESGGGPGSGSGSRLAEVALKDIKIDRLKPTYDSFEKMDSGLKMLELASKMVE